MTGATVPDVGGNGGGYGVNEPPVGPGAPPPGGLPPPPTGPPGWPPGPQRGAGFGLGVAVVIGVVVVVALFMVAAMVLIVVKPHRNGGIDADTTWQRRDRTGIEALVGNGELVCGTEERELFCVDGDSGDDVFSEPLPGPGTAPALAGGTLLVAADGGPGHGDLYAYSLAGEQLWEATDVDDIDIDDTALLRPDLPVAGGIVVAAIGESSSGGLVGVDVESGQAVWRAFGLDDPDWRSDVVGPLGGDVLSDGERFYMAAVVRSGATASVDGIDEVVVAVDPATGTELWRTEPRDMGGEAFLDAVAPIGGDSSGGGSGDDDGDDDGDGVTRAVLAFVGDDAEVFAVDTATGERLWDVPIGGDRPAVVPFEDATIVADVAAIRAYDADGRELWSATSPERRRGNVDPLTPELVVDQGRLFAFRSHLYEVDPEDGSAVLLRDLALTDDVAVAGDDVVTAGLSLAALPLPD